MTRATASLDELLAGEIERRLPVLDPSRAPGDVRAAMHSLKGSLALAGYPELALVLGQLSGRLREGEHAALDETLALLTEVLGRLRRGEPALAETFPVPPPRLGPPRLDARFRGDYHAAMRHRLGEIDAVLASTGAAVAGLDRAQRSVHAMKGAAASIGDDVVLWYCHGLETRLRAVPRDVANAQAAVVELARHRAMIALLVEDPARGIETLRRLGAAGEEPMLPEAVATTPLPPRATEPPPRRSTRPPALPAAPEREALRIAPSDVDRLLSRIDQVNWVGRELERSADVARQTAARLRTLQEGLQEALRQIGPARPWGPPVAALARIEAAQHGVRAAATNAERSSQALRRGADSLAGRSSEMKSALAELRRTTAGPLFARVSAAAARFAEAEGKSVRVILEGEEVPIDRGVAERLYDSLIQLAKNAVSHGIQPPAARRAEGRPERGTVSLRAERSGEWLRIQVEDDGSGVDTERLRELAVQRGLLTPERARDASEAELLPLLFLPGLTTISRADLLRGRGLGLELAEDTVRRLGGTLYLRSRRGGGVTATLEIPNDPGSASVLWVRESGEEYALPTDYVGRMGPYRTGTPCVRLSACLGRPVHEQAPVVLELRVEGTLPVAIGVEQATHVESVVVRAVPSLIARAGPYAGAVLRNDGTLKLSLDAPLLAARAWALSQ